MSRAFEVNFDGLVGPTHNYAGLSPGNLASQKNSSTVSHPRAAALQGLAKMKLLHDLGVKQATLPPHRRPDLRALRSSGFEGSDAEIIRAAAEKDPRRLAAVYSSSAMWSANAATVSPSSDTSDGRVHFTPANLLTQFHRSLEAPTTAALLRAIFPNEVFAHHNPLPAQPPLADEGAANHMRLCVQHEDAGIEIFIYGRSANAARQPTKFPARQTLEACKAIAASHRLDHARTIFLQQNPDAIDGGAFHNDVVAVSNQNVLLVHGSAFADQGKALGEIADRFQAQHGIQPVFLVASAHELSLADAVQSYVFNSQVVTLPDDSMAMIAPIECKDHPGVQHYLQRVVSTSPIRSIHYQDVRQSMNNGGGPACLRLRVVVSEEQFSSIHRGVIYTEKLHEQLSELIKKRYRETLQPSDLADPSLVPESNNTVDEILKVLDLSGVI